MSEGRIYSGKGLVMNCDVRNEHLWSLPYSLSEMSVVGFFQKGNPDDTLKHTKTNKSYLYVRWVVSVVNKESIDFKVGIFVG